MARVTADQAAAKWTQRLTAATTQITDGVNRVQTAPGLAAAAQKALWLQRVQASQDKWARNVSAVSLESWRASMINIGIPRIASGASAKAPKVQAFMQQFLPYVDQGVSKVRAMPKGTLDQSIARATAMIQHNAAFKRSATA